MELPTTGPSLFNGTIDVWSASLTNINFARILTGMKMVPPAGYQNLKVRFNSPSGVFRFVKKNDPTKWMDAVVRMKHENLPAQNVMSMVDYPIVAGSVGAPRTVTDLFMDVTVLPPNSGQSYRGDYYFPLLIQILDPDGYVLTEKTLQMTLYFRTRDVPATPVTTLTLARYPAADAITAPYPYLGTTPLTTVGRVDFQSNEDYNRYRVKVSPVGQTLFQFTNTNTNLGGTIPYVVAIPGRTVSHDRSFEFNLDYKGSIGNWYDSFEIGVSNVNYSNVRNPAGSYISTILIELIAF